MLLRLPSFFAEQELKVNSLLGFRVSRICLRGLLLSLVLPAVALAQNFPAKAITIVVPYTAGGGTDTFARAIGQQLATSLGVSVVVENKPGASGAIGADVVARAVPDGHTLLYAASTIATAALTTPNIKLDPLRDLMPVTQTMSIPHVVAVHTSVPARSIAELMALIKGSPSKYTYGSGGQGSAAHLATELWAQKSGLKVRHIPYKGAAPAVNALIAGQIDIALLVPPLVQANIKAGRLRALAVTSATRSSALAEVETMQEAGIKEFEALQWHGLFAPVGTPLAVADQLRMAVAQALASPAVKKLLAQEGAVGIGNTPEQFKSVLVSEIAYWSALNRPGI